MSTSANGTFIEFKICTHVFENPHLGASFVPFMNSTTRCLRDERVDGRAQLGPHLRRDARVVARVRSRTARAPSRVARVARIVARRVIARAIVVGVVVVGIVAPSRSRAGAAPAPRRRAIDRASSSSNLAPSIARRGRSSTRRSRRERSIDRGSRDPKIQTRPTASLIVAPRSNRRATATRAMAHRATVSIDARARGDAWRRARRAARRGTARDARRAGRMTTTTRQMRATSTTRCDGLARDGTRRRARRGTRRRRR